MVLKAWFDLFCSSLSFVLVDILIEVVVAIVLCVDALMRKRALNYH